MKRKIHKKIGLYIQLSVLAVSLLILAVYIADTSIYQAQTETLAQEYNDDWRLSDGSEIELPGRIPYAADGVVQLFNILPPVEDGSALSVQTHAQRLFVYIDGEEIYRFANIMPHGDVSGRYLNLITLPKSASGKTICIRFENEVPGQSEVFCALRDIRYGSVSALERLAFLENAHVIFAFGFSLVASAFLFASATLLKRKKGTDNISNIVILSTFILLSGSWLLTDSFLLQFFVQNDILIYYLSFLLFMMLPVVFLQYLKSILSRPRLLLDIYSIVCLVHCALAFLLDFTGRAPLVRTLPIAHMLLVGMVVITFVFLFVDLIKYKNKTVILPCVGIIVLGLSALVSLLLFGVESFSKAQYSMVFIFGFVVFTLCVMLQSIGKGRKLYIENAKLEIYRQLAVTDVMTGLSNRAAFDADMAMLEIEIEKYAVLSIAILDINGLKQCNDAYGHHNGDRLIKACGDCITQTLAPLGQCYRIGGDEFAILFFDVDRTEIDGAVEQFMAAIKTYNLQHTHMLSVAVGVATETSEEGPMISGTAAALFQLADRMMYKQKAKDKEQTHS
ncbi:MAG: GGDEF domain-containing protein [Candidatus Howiella sp.]|jgi:diguanylate cyclase